MLIHNALIPEMSENNMIYLQPFESYHLGNEKYSKYLHGISMMGHADWFYLSLLNKWSIERGQAGVNDTLQLTDHYANW